VISPGLATPRDEWSNACRVDLVLKEGSETAVVSEEKRIAPKFLHSCCVCCLNVHSTGLSDFKSSGGYMNVGRRVLLLSSCL
jgi:hypothetical protein